MADFDDKLQAILGNPEIMGQIMSMAGSMNQQPPKPTPQKPPMGLPFDAGSMQSMMNLLRATQLDERQQNLICALRGFVPEDRLERLQKAMQASLIAKFASTAMGKGG